MIKFIAARDVEVQELRGQLQEAQELHTRLAERQAAMEEDQGRQHAQEIEALEEENLKLMDMLEEKTVSGRVCLLLKSK